MDKQANTVQKFQEGDIVRHQHDFTCYMITYAESTDTLPSGETVDFTFWDYIAIPIGFGDGTEMPFESYNEGPPNPCPQCRKREFGCDTLELVLRTGVSREALEGISF